MFVGHVPWQLFLVNKQDPEFWLFLMVSVFMNITQFCKKKKLVCFTIISIQTANYHPDMNLYPDTSSATDKSTLYSVDINSNNYASWKQESIWFHSVDQSIGM